MSHDQPMPGWVMLKVMAGRTKAQGMQTRNEMDHLGGGDPSQSPSPAENGRRIRLFAYCHEGMGIGHLRRTLTICNQLGRVYPSLERRIATGSPYVSLFEATRGAGWFKLPTIIKRTDGRYFPAARGLLLERLLETRRQLLLGAVSRFQPDVMLVDKAPVGVCGELGPALQWVREHLPQTRIIFGMRDIEDEPGVTIEQWSALGAQEALERCYDEVWVYGMQELFDVVKQYALSSKIADKVRFLGYVCDASTSRECDGQRRTDGAEVVVTVGGGTDGGRLIATYLAKTASAVAGAGLRSTIVAGPDLPRPHSAQLRARAGSMEGVSWVDSASDMRDRLARARLVVSMGGYNSLCELVSLGRRALIVPRSTPRREQVMRACLWEDRGVIRVLHPDELTAESLSDSVMRWVRVPGEVTRDGLDFGGLERAVERFGVLMGAGGSRHEAAVRVQ